MPAASPSFRRVVRCFARSDETLVDEWPVTAELEALKALVAAPSDPQLREIHAIEQAIAEKLLGRTFDYSEQVEFFLEPADVQVD